MRSVGGISGSSQVEQINTDIAPEPAVVNTGSTGNTIGSFGDTPSPATAQPSTGSTGGVSDVLGGGSSFDLGGVLSNVFNLSGASGANGSEGASASPFDMLSGKSGLGGILGSLFGGDSSGGGPFGFLKSMASALGLGGSGGGGFLGGIGDMIGGLFGGAGNGFTSILNMVGGLFGGGKSDGSHANDALSNVLSMVTKTNAGDTSPPPTVDGTEETVASDPSEWESPPDEATQEVA